DGNSQQRRVLAAQLKDVADLDGLNEYQARAAPGAWFTFGDFPEVRPYVHGDVPVDVDVCQVHVVDVRPRRQSAATAQRQIGDHRELGDADRAEAARQRAERCLDFVWLSRANRDGSGRIDELLVGQRMIAAEQHQGQLAVYDLD